MNCLSKSTDLSKKKPFISSRFSSKGYYNSISFHRQLLLEKIKDNELFMTGRLSHKDYLNECSDVQDCSHHLVGVRFVIEIIKLLCVAIF